MASSWMTLEEVAEHLRMGRTKLYRLAQSGEIPCAKVRGQYRFDREEIDRWVHGQRVDGPEGGYVHGYSVHETTRLVDQATTLAELLHHDTRYPAGARVLEAGCGVGAQTQTLAPASPEALFVAVDVAQESLDLAKQRMEERGITNVLFQRADVYDLPFSPESFDHVFVCFLLEHLPDRVDALRCLKRMLKPGGTITVVEGDHGSTYFHPESDAARAAIRCQVTLQAGQGGDALLGRRLYPLLVEAGFAEVRVSPRMVYVDGSRPELADGFTRKTFTAMVRGVREDALAEGLIDAATFDRGIADLERAAEPDGTFCYTFFKGFGANL